MAVWLSFAAMAVLASIGPVLGLDSSAVVMPGVNSRSSSINMAMRRRRPVRTTPSPDVHLSPDAKSADLRQPIYFPPNTHNMFDQPMVMTDDMYIDMMDIGNLRMLNSISTMEEYAAMLGIEMPVAANDSDNGIAARFGSGGSEVKLDQAICKPEETTVELNITAEPNVVYIPSCVRLQRCGGCCGRGTVFTCQPKKTEAINIKVMRVTSSPLARSPRLDTGRERPGNSGRKPASRRRRQNIAELITVPEVQHIECDCLCRVQEEDCNQTLQEYMPDNCRCQCRNSDEEEKCATKTMTHYWDDDKCTCFCHNTVNCSVTLRFDHTNCSCVKDPQNLLPTEGLANDPRAGFVGVQVLQDEKNERFRPDHIPVTFGASGARWGGATRAREQLPRA